MKKLLYSLAAVATLLFAASCAQENLGRPAGEDTVEATFKVALPDAVGTKAISDGKEAKELLFFAFDGKGKYLANVKPAEAVTVNNYEASVTVKLIKGMTYSFVFWAQTPGKYTDKITVADGTPGASLDISSIAASMMNDDSFDAFYGRISNYKVEKAFSTEQLILTRPFAQVNVGAYAEDIAAAQASNLETGADVLKTKYFLGTEGKLKVNTTLDLLKGAADGETEIDLTAALRPSETLTVDGTDYTWLAMIYLLQNAPDYYDSSLAFVDEEETKTVKDEVDFNIATTQNGDAVTTDRNVYNVPVQRNYRTNILGNIFSVDGTFNIKVDQNFQKINDVEQPYLPEYADIAALNAAFAKADATDADKWSYKVKVLAPGTDTKIVLPNTTDPVDIVLADGAWADAEIEIAYAEGTDVAKPTKLTLKVDELKGLTANITSTHFELVAGSHVVNAEVATSNSTFVIQKTAKVDNLKINAGGLVIEEGATVENISVDINADVTLPEELAEKATYFGKVASETALRKAVAEGGEFTIAENIDVKEGAIDVVPGKTLVLDLNKKTLSYSGEYMSNGLIWVHRGATATIKNGTITTGDKAYAPVQVTKKGDNADGVATLVVEDITLNGGEAGITGNGSRHNTNITVNNAVISASNGPGIYHPQDGTITIKGENTVITGVETGIEMRAGTLNIEGGKLVSTATEVSATPNGNGTAVKGSAVAVAQHTTQKDITVNISGGVFDGPYALYEVNVQQNDPIHVTLNVTGGTFNGQVYSQDCTGFITGGTFAADPSAYVATGYIATLADGKYVVAEGARKTPEFSVAPESLNLFVGGNGELVLTNTSDGELTVASDTPDVATVAVDETTGKYVVTAVDAGSANITFAVAQSNTNEAAEATVKVTVTAVELESIAVTAPTKVDYYVGDAIDLAGIVITATNNDGSTFEVTEGYTTDAETVLAEAGEKKDVTVTYKGKTATFKVTVSEKPIVYTSIAALKGMITAENTTFAEPVYLKTVTITGVNGGQAFMEDETGGILLYLKDHGMKVGETYTGAKVSGGTIRYSLPQITTFADAVKGEDATLTPEIMTIEDLASEGALDLYGSMLVKVENVNVVNAVVAGEKKTINLEKDGKTINAYVVPEISAIKAGSVVSITGNFYAIGSGVPQINVTYDAARVEIISEPLDKAVITGMPASITTLKAGESHTFTATVNNVTGATVNYAITEGASYATLDGAKLTINTDAAAGSVVKVTASVDGVEGSFDAAKPVVCTITVAETSQGGGDDPKPVVVLSDSFDNDLENDATSEIILKDFPNWSAKSKVYKGAGGTLKFGSSSAVGTLTSKELDLSGSFTVEIDVKKYGSDSGKVTVTVGEQSKEITPSSDFKSEKLSFTAATSTSKIVIATTSKRAYIDNVVVTVTK